MYCMKLLQSINHLGNLSINRLGSLSSTNTKHLLLDASEIQMFTDHYKMNTFSWLLDKASKFKTSLWTLVTLMAFAIIYDIF